MTIQSTTAQLITNRAQLLEVLNAAAAVTKYDSKKDHFKEIQFKKEGFFTASNWNRTASMKTKLSLLDTEVTPGQDFSANVEQLLQAVKVQKRAAVTIEVTPEHLIIDGAARISQTPAQVIPDYNFYNFTSCANFSAEQIKMIHSKISYNASDNKMTPILTGINLKIDSDAGTANATATNRHRLANLKLTCDARKKEEINIHTDNIKILQSLKKNIFMFTVDENESAPILFEAGPSLFYFYRLDPQGKYPDTSRILEGCRNNPHPVTVSRAELVAHLDAIKKMRIDKPYLIIKTGEHLDEITIELRDRYNAKISASGIEQPLKFALNPAYLLDAANATAGEYLTIKAPEKSRDGTIANPLYIQDGPAEVIILPYRMSANE